MRNLGPLDQDILRVLAPYNGGLPSYIVRNIFNLRHSLRHYWKLTLTTRYILYRLKVLEEHLLVRRVPTSYKTMITWAVTDKGRERAKL